MALPAAVQYGTVTWTAVTAVADAADADAQPDAVPVAGKVTFTPSATVLLATAGAPVTVIATPVTYDLDNNGVLRDSQGHTGVMLVATDSPGITPTGWTWNVSYRLNPVAGQGVSRGSFSFALPSGSTVDLTTVAPVSASGGAAIIQGPQGPPGSAYPLVIHGTDANFPRPSVSTPVIWFGTVEPVNADDTRDVWVPVSAG
jgi:hypothetical protein